VNTFKWTITFSYVKRYALQLLAYSWCFCTNGINVLLHLSLWKYFIYRWHKIYLGTVDKLNIKATFPKFCLCFQGVFSSTLKYLKFFQASSYGTIPLLLHFYKLFVKVINHKLYVFCEKHGALFQHTLDLVSDLVHQLLIHSYQQNVLFSKLIFM